MNKKLLLPIILILCIMLVQNVNATWVNYGNTAFNTSNSSVIADSNGANKYSNAFDRNTGTYWQPGTAIGDPSWVLLRFINQSSFNINRTDLTWFDTSYCGQTVSIYGSDDYTANGTNGAWTFIYTKSSACASANISIPFSNNNVYKNYLLNITANSPANPAIKEMYIYGDNTNIGNNTNNLTGNIILVNKSLGDITNTNLFNIPIVNYTYQFENYVGNESYSNNLISTLTYYSITSSILNCVQSYNGTCMAYNNTFNSRNSFYSVTSGNYTNASFNFSENDVYPYTQNTNSTLIALGIHTDVITGTNNYYADELLNITAGQYNFYEMPILSNGTVEIYYYNSSYTTGNPTTNVNVHLLCTYPNLTSYNHTHTVSTYTFGHNVCGFFVNSTGFVGSVKYSGGGFLTRGNAQGVNIVLANSTARVNAIRSTNNGGNTYNNVVGTIISHLHMFGSSDTFNIYASGNYGASGIKNSSVYSDNLDITPFNPEPPTVQIPNGSGTFGKFINITWELAIPTTPNSIIKNYTVSLLNEGGSLNATLNQTSNNATNSFLWNSYNYNLSTQLNYIIRITATDNNSLNSSSYSDLINFSTNAEINISAKLFNGTVITNFSIYYTGKNTGNCTTNNTYCLIDIIKNTNNNYLFNTTGYSFTNTSIISTNITSYYQFNIYTTNSVNFTVYDSTTNIILSTSNVSVQLVGTYQQYNFTIVNGTKYVDLLAPDTYNALFSSSGYYTKNYIITVSPNQYQYLNAYLLNNTNPNNKQINFLITDTSALPLEGVLVQVQRLLNTTYSTVESRYTDISGQVQFSLDTTLFYRIIESKNGYVTKVYQIQPISTSYTDRMSDTNTITNTNLFSNITYYTLPLNSTIYPIPAVQNFQFITAGNGIVSFSISDGNNSQNISTGSGGTAQINYIPTNNNTKTIRIYYYINTINNGNYTFSQDYTFSNVAENSNYTISTGSFNPSFSKDGKIIIGAIITVIVLIGLGAFMSGAVLTVVTIGLIILMVALGFYPMWIGVAFGVLLSLTLYIKER